jgi:hypothetical protein
LLNRFYTFKIRIKMAKKSSNELTASQHKDLLATLKARFENNMQRHERISWSEVEKKLTYSNTKCRSLFEMEKTGGEPDVVGYNKKSDSYIFYDCSPESPSGRRSTCYDIEGLRSRKEYAPQNNAMDMAAEMGIEMLDEEAYRNLQKLGNFDTKTSSWIKTPDDIRKLGGALFGDYRYGKVFIYHNGAQSYYAARGFRGSVFV